MKPHADLIQLSPCQGCPAWHSSVVPEGLVCQDSALVTDMQEGGAPLGDTGNGVVLELTPGVPQPGLEEVRNQSVLVQSQESSLWAPGQWEVPMQALESIRPQCAMDGLRHDQTDGSSKVRPFAFRWGTAACVPVRGRDSRWCFSWGACEMRHQH